MRIIYVTTAIDANDYKSFVSLWSKKPNPSNQNFHNKLIRCLAMNNDVDVVSIRPFSRKLVSVKSLPKEEKVTNNIKWHYLQIKGAKIIRFFSIKKDCLKIFKKDEINDAIIITDTINPNCLSASVRMSKTYKLPLIGICSDSPSNITGTNRSYTLYLLKKASRCNGYISLTSELNTLYNEDNKPNIVIEGIVEHNPDIVPHVEYRPYFFFGGSLLQRYGVNELIAGFKKLNRSDVQLVLAGHSGNDQSILSQIKDRENIQFVGTLDINSVLSYEAGAIANINPRPFSEDLDRFSVPSKTIEYLTSGAITISVRNSKLRPYFENEIYWLNDATEDSICAAMANVLNMNEADRKAFGLKAKEKVLSLFSMDQVNQKLVQFLTIFAKK